MRKPRIEVRPAKGFEEMGNHIFINNRNLTPDQIAYRYERLIDALIAMREVSLNDNRGLTEALEKTDKALEIAGVELWPNRK